jgi:hypothetical protein
MKAKNSGSFSQAQIQKTWEKTEKNKQYRRFIASMVILVTFVMTSGFSVASAPSAQATAPQSPSTLCLDDYGPIAFGEVIVGQSARRRLILENCGSTPLTLGETTLTGPNSSDFSTDNPAGVVLHEQQKCYITTTFEPQALRNAERIGQLNIPSSSNQARVRLTGTSKIPDGNFARGPAGVPPSDVPPCVPQKPYDLVCLVNQTDWPINYSYKWGDGEWKPVSVSANGYRYHSWRYAAGSQVSPNFQVSFDADFTDGTDYKLYNLKRYPVPDKTCQAGKVYEFKTIGRNAIELYDSGN